jgi:hypothetical protein
MNRLLVLYPRAWRDRYQTEMGAVLDDLPFTPRAALDLVLGAVDAHLNPQGGRPPLRLPVAYQVALLAMLGTTLDAVWQVALQQITGRTLVTQGLWYWLELVPLATALLGALAAWRARWTTTAWFCLLAALQVALGGVLAEEQASARALLEPVRAFVAGVWHPGFRLAWLLVAGQMAAGAAAVALLLRLARVAWPLGLAVGLALFAASAGYAIVGEQPFLPSYPVWPGHPAWFRLSWLIEPAQVAAWAALAAALLRRTGLPWWAGLLVGASLWLLLGPQSSLGSWLLSTGLSYSANEYFWRLPSMLWAAILAAAITRTRGTPGLVPAI